MEEHILACNFAAFEISSYCNRPTDILGVVLANKRLYRLWKQFLPRLYSLWKLSNSIFARHYVPDIVFANNEPTGRLTISDTVTLGSKVIGEISRKNDIWIRYTVNTLVPFNSAILELIGKTISYKGRKFRVVFTIENENMLEIVTQNNYGRNRAEPKADAVDQCKAVYEYFSQF